MTRLGRTEVEVAPLGLGTWSWRDGGEWGFGRIHDEEDIRQAFKVGAARGSMRFDTAKRYVEASRSDFWAASFARRVERGDRYQVLAHAAPTPAGRSLPRVRGRLEQLQLLRFDL